MNRLLLAPIALLAACSGAVDSPDGTASSSLALSPAQAARVLDLVNYPGTDEGLLNRTVGLDARAAHNIVTQRNGADGVTPSADDQPFATLAALDAVSYVGDSALSKLQFWSNVHPAPAAETVEGVHFAGWESQSVVWGVNQASVAELNAFIDARAASGLIAKRPFTTVAAMGPVAYVGTAALTALHAHAAAWWAAMRGAPSLAGTFDSVSFDEATAEIALAIANQATSAQLTQHGVTATPAAHLIAARAFTTLAQVAAVSGVGTATMNALHAYAASGQWGAPPVDCIGSFEAAVSPHLPDLLFLSESDRPIDVVTFPGAGGSGPTTAAALMALLKSPAGSTTETRDPNNYYVDFEPASSTADPNAGADVQAAIAAQLTDVVYIAVMPPADSPDRSAVDVYLVGRTSCGDLVGLHAISIET